MDSRLVNEKAEAFGDRSVRINPAVMAQLGLEKRGIHLKIDEFFVSCVPFDLSLRAASVLCFLSPNEVLFFEKMKGRPHTLNLLCRSPDSGKPVAFFVRCDLLAFRKPDPASPYCFIDLAFRETPFLLKELLVTWFVENERSELFWSQALAQDQGLTPEAIDRVFPEQSLELLKEGVIAERLRVSQLSARRIRLFGEYDGPAPSQGELLDIESRGGEGACLVRGTCVEFTPFAEARGFAFISIEPQFSFVLATRMRQVMQGKGGRGSTAGRGESGAAEQAAGTAPRQEPAAG